MRTAATETHDRPKCKICGEEIKPTDREAVFITMCKTNGGLKESKGYVCGDCMQSAEAKFFKLWRVAK